MVSQHTLPGDRTRQAPFGRRILGSALFFLGPGPSRRGRSAGRPGRLPHHEPDRGAHADSSAHDARARYRGRSVRLHGVTPGREADQLPDGRDRPGDAGESLGQRRRERERRAQDNPGRLGRLLARVVLLHLWNRSHWGWPGGDGGGDEPGSLQRWLRLLLDRERVRRQQHLRDPRELHRAHDSGRGCRGELLLRGELPQLHDLCGDDGRGRDTLSSRRALTRNANVNDRKLVETKSDPS